MNHDIRQILQYDLMMIPSMIRFILIHIAIGSIRIFFASISFVEGLTDIYAYVLTDIITLIARTVYSTESISRKNNSLLLRNIEDFLLSVICCGVVSQSSSMFPKTIGISFTRERMAPQKYMAGTNKQQLLYFEVSNLK
jgi:hypothetical protein